VALAAEDLVFGFFATDAGLLVIHSHLIAMSSEPLMIACIWRMLELAIGVQTCGLQSITVQSATVQSCSAIDFADGRPGFRRCRICSHSCGLLVRWSTIDLPSHSLLHFRSRA
jgi:hypothetical protein